MLLPRYFKIIGLILIVPSLVLGLMFQLTDYVIPFLNYNGKKTHNAIFAAVGQKNLTDELLTTLLILGFVFAGFSKQKNERELIQNFRLKALFWAVLIHGFLISSLLIVFNSGIFKFDFINKYDSAILNIILDNNLFVLPIIFLLRLYYLLYRDKKESKLYYIASRPLILAGKVTASILFIFTVLALFNILVIKQLNKAIFLLLPSILTWVWSVEKAENAEVENIRLRAMYLSVTFNYSVFIALTWVIYGINYLAVLYIGLASIPLAFIPIFYWLKFRDKQHRAQVALL